MKKNWVSKSKRNFFCVAGGSGITPIWQVIEAICLNKEHDVNILVIYGNKTPEDILLRKELDGYAAANHNFKLV